ncbi:Reverse transcriptase domain [Trinorchestia longiramus]|nr:Reverse transcriptase domain [Trinorchestia longiramus]
MAIDFSKAFDTVLHLQLIYQISSLPLNHYIVRSLVCYLRGRSAKCSYHHHLSSSRLALAGVPQDFVISPALFNLFVSDYPPTVPLITSYANDFTAITTTIKIPDAFANSSEVATWAQQKGLTVSKTKSQSSLFTPDTHQSRTNPHVTWEGTDLTHCRSPKILGITFDPHFTFSPHNRETPNNPERRPSNSLRVPQNSFRLSPSQGGGGPPCSRLHFPPLLPTWQQRTASFKAMCPLMLIQSVWYPRV